MPEDEHGYDEIRSSCRTVGARRTRRREENVANRTKGHVGPEPVTGSPRVSPRKELVRQRRRRLPGRTGVSLNVAVAGSLVRYKLAGMI
jgi:hypothetical protein